jgi:hypothetical protein
VVSNDLSLLGKMVRDVLLREIDEFSLAHMDKVEELPEAMVVLGSVDELRYP